MKRVSGQLKVLRGTHRSDRAPKRSAAERLQKAPPAPLELSPFARGEWRSLAPLLVQMGVLCKTDLKALALLCHVLESEQELRALLKKEGLTIPGADGNWKAHPALKALETSRNQCFRLLDSFGLTPRGREGIAIAPPAKSSMFDKLNRP